MAVEAWLVGPLQVVPPVIAVVEPFAAVPTRRFLPLVTSFSKVTSEDLLQDWFDLEPALQIRGEKRISLCALLYPAKKVPRLVVAWLTKLRCMRNPNHQKHKPA